jgi:hypothetical protein
MVKGNQKQDNERKLYVGFANVRVAAVNPDRKELNALLGKEDSEDDKPIEYVDEYDGTPRVRIAVWLREEGTNRLFVHSFNMLNKERTNKDGSKYQYINNTCSTSWADEDSNLMEWFTKFTNKNKEVVGDKTFRKALVGEEELASLIRSWLGKLNFNDPDTDVTVDTKKLFKGNFKELQEQIDGDFDTSFVALLGVRTVEPKEGEEGETKQYQAVYGKSFLPGQFIKYINNDLKFPTDYTKKVWSKFSDEVTGEYGANFYYEFEPLAEYDKSRDLSASDEKKQDLVETDSKY